MKGSIKLVSLATAALALAFGTSLAGARTARPIQALCTPGVHGGTVTYCGPAKAHLSKFPGVTFRPGSCKRSTVGGRQLMIVAIGVRTQNRATNAGRTYFGLSISGPFTHPTGGGVIAYWHSKRWGGRGVSFRGNASSGTFVARGINGSPGTATGSYRCS